MRTTKTSFTCPDCGGAIERIDDGNLLQYRCRVGHLYSPETALAVHSEREENTVWTAVVLLREAAELAEEIADTQSSERAEALRAQAQAKRELADVVEQVADQFPKIPS